MIHYVAIVHANRRICEQECLGRTMSKVYFQADAVHPSARLSGEGVHRVVEVMYVSCMIQSHCESLLRRVFSVVWWIAMNLHAMLMVSRNHKWHN